MDSIAAELTTLLEKRMTDFYTNFQVDEIGRVVSVGDGIARVYGLKVPCRGRGAADRKECR